MLGALSISPFPETLARIKALIPQAEFVTLPEASHMMNIEDKAGFLAALDRFLP